MSESFKWKIGSDIGSSHKKSSKLRFWSNDSYKSGKLNKDLEETERLYSFDDNHESSDCDHENSDDNEHNIDDKSIKSNKYFQLKNRNYSQKSGLNCDKSSKKSGLNKNSSLVECLNYKIQENDTLQSIALRYGCSLSQIKRINHLITDQEFYGLAFLKLPVKKFGILSDVLIHQVNSGSLLDTDNIEPNSTQIANQLDIENKPSNSLTVNIGISQHLSRNNSEDGFRFLNHLDNDLKKIRESTKTVIESSNVFNLDNNSDHTSRTDSTTESIKLKRSAFFSCDESDYGINWFNLLLLAFVLCFLIPIVYVVYISESHNSTISNIHINH